MEISLKDIDETYINVNFENLKIEDKTNYNRLDLYELFFDDYIKLNLEPADTSSSVKEKVPNNLDGKQLEKNLRNILEAKYYCSQIVVSDKINTETRKYKFRYGKIIKNGNEKIFKMDITKTYEIIDNTYVYNSKLCNFLFKIKEKKSNKDDANDNNKDFWKNFLAENKNSSSSSSNNGKNNKPSKNNYSEISFKNITHELTEYITKNNILLESYFIAQKNENEKKPHFVDNDAKIYIMQPEGEFDGIFKTQKDLELSIFNDKNILYKSKNFLESSQNNKSDSDKKNESFNMTTDSNKTKYIIPAKKDLILESKGKPNIKELYSQLHRDMFFLKFVNYSNDVYFLVTVNYSVEYEENFRNLFKDLDDLISKNGYEIFKLIFIDYSQNDFCGENVLEMYNPFALINEKINDMDEKINDMYEKINDMNEKINDMYEKMDDMRKDMYEKMDNMRKDMKNDMLKIFEEKLSENFNSFYNKLLENINK